MKGAALPKAKQWAEWSAYHLADAGAQPWLTGLRVALTRWHRVAEQIARRLRGNAAWTGSGTEEDWMPVRQQADQLQAWWQTNAPRELRHQPRMKPVMEALDGAMAQLCRLAAEVDTAQATHGLTAVNVNPHTPLGTFPEQ